MSLNAEDELMATFGWEMGATSSCINDIANDNFIPNLQIETFTQNSHTIESRNYNYPVPNPNTFSAPIIHICNSDISNSNLLRPIDEKILLPSKNEIKSVGSDVSLSFFLDSEQIHDRFDDNSFANVNSNLSGSKKNSIFDLNEEC